VRFFEKFPCPHSFFDVDNVVAFVLSKVSVEFPFSWEWLASIICSDEENANRKRLLEEKETRAEQRRIAEAEEVGKALSAALELGLAEDQRLTRSLSQSLSQSSSLTGPSPGPSQEQEVKAHSQSF
jgi:hypothetical protein